MPPTTSEFWRWEPQYLSEKLEFETDIRMARAAEWRDGLKDATQFYEFSHILPSATAEKLLGKVENNAVGTWFVPEWPMRSTIVGTVGAGSSVLPVPVPEAYTVGGIACIGVGDDDRELLLVNSLGAGVINVSFTAVSRTGTQQRPIVVAPVVNCIGQMGAEFQSYFPNKDVSMSFMSIEPRNLAGNHYALFDSMPAVIDGGVAFQALRGSVNQATDLFASGFGAYFLQPVENYTRRGGTVSWFDQNPVDRWNRRKFLHYLRGRDAPFLAPSFQRDLVLTANVNAAAISMSVVPSLPNSQMVGKYLMLSENGVRAFTKVSAASGTTTQTLAIQATGVAFTSAAAVSFVTKSRLDTDDLSINYQFSSGDIAMSCSYPIIEVL